MLYPKQSQTRCVLDLNGIWDLAREHEKCGQEDGFEAEKKVAVPCSYNDLYAEEGFRMWSGGVWYSRTFVVPRALRGERLVLRFGSVAYSAEVYVNGLRAGAHAGGHTPFEFDVTHLVGGGDNLLCVRGENALSAETVPMGGLNNAPENGQFAGQYPDVPFDFFPYGGIQRNVCLYTTSPDGWISDIRVVTTIDGATGRVSIEGAVDGAGGIGDTIHITVDGATTAAILDPADAGNSRRFNVDLVIEDCKFWGVGAPNLYVATIALVDGAGAVVDEYAQRFGVRTIAVAGDRLLLNGAPVYLQGFGRHEDFPIVGKGLCHGVNVRDHELLKWINANSYRTTHYPYSEELVALADEQGILLIAEAPAVSINFDFVTPKTLENHRAALRELIERDRNAPSVIMWSVANEATTNRPEARPYFSELAADARSLDGTRPVTMVTCKVEDDAVVDLFDVVGVNFYPGWYHLPGVGARAPWAAQRDNMRDALSALHAKCGKPIFVSEFGADALAGMHALPAEQWSEEYQADLIMELISVFRELDFVVGEHVWNFADFRTAQNFPRVGGNKKGVFTRDRQPKMAAHFLKRQWATPRY
ncbi:beta-glucuronidase [Aureococcus anophagefferens]|uniref:Beta-glucuronidase n=1 Tax=Aureococcus anophagefferens TaxID=44056 RepID=A0ABR1FS20_AURAN